MNQMTTKTSLAKNLPHLYCESKTGLQDIHISSQPQPADNGKKADWDHEVKNFTTSTRHTVRGFPLKIIASTRIKGPFLLPTLLHTYNTKNHPEVALFFPTPVRRKTIITSFLLIRIPENFK